MLSTAMGVYEGVSAAEDAYNAASGRNSFPADTLVATPAGHKRIADLRPGDKVLAYAEWKQQTQEETVTDLLLSRREQTIVTITLATGERIEATGGHPIHTPDGWRAAQLLLAGGQLDVKDAQGRLVPMDIVSVATRTEVVEVYNLEVSNAHTYYVGEDNVLVHNPAAGPFAPYRGVPGVYEFTDDAGNWYVGKATDAADRLGKHCRKGRFKAGQERFTPMPGSTDAQRRQEELRRLAARGGPGAPLDPANPGGPRVLNERW